MKTGTGGILIAAQGVWSRAVALSSSLKPPHLLSLPRPWPRSRDTTDNHRAGDSPPPDRLIRATVHPPRFANGQKRKKSPAVSGEAPLDPLREMTYSTIEATMPAPTVRPPSRIAKRSFSSIAIGTISSTSTVTLSPGITISVPSGSDTMPVTSVVRK
jgi:hypothetical protein